MLIWAKTCEKSSNKHRNMLKIDANNRAKTFFLYKRSDFLFEALSSRDDMRCRRNRIEVVEATSFLPINAWIQWVKSKFNKPVWWRIRRLQLCNSPILDCDSNYFDIYKFFCEFFQILFRFCDFEKQLWVPIFFNSNFKTNEICGFTLIYEDFILLQHVWRWNYLCKRWEDFCIRFFAAVLFRSNRYC